MAEVKYDSRADTLTHIKRVNELLGQVATEFIRRGNVHDQSKLEEPEKTYFDNAVHPSTLVYGSEEYRLSIESIRPAIDHHYANNSHHPQHYPEGINDMDLFDLHEMLVDWKASGERNIGGDINESLRINAERFGISKQLRKILQNTIDRYLTQ